MSVRVMSMVWQFPASHAEKIVLLKLADCANDEGASIYPSVARMAKECGMSERNVRTVLAKYRAAGLLVVVAREDAGSKRPTVYRFDLAKLGAAKPENTPEARSPLNVLPPDP